MNTDVPTPETDDAMLHDGDGQELVPPMVLASHARSLERRLHVATEALRFIEQHGGRSIDVETGVRCDGTFCGEQARTALYTIEKIKP